MEQGRTLTLKHIILLTIAAFGIQFGSALQMANMGSIYKYLGVNVDNMAILWLAAPITGLIAQPIIGFMSDQTWCRFLPKRFGRRQPYILTYGILGCLSLFLMPNSNSVLMAALLLWILDLSQNGATEPFRAMLGDFTPNKQMTKVFAIQTIFASLGATLADVLPWLAHHFDPHPITSTTTIPNSIKLAFYIGGASFLFFMCITITTNKEHPPLSHKQYKRSLWQSIKLLMDNIIHMPPVIRNFWIPQLFTWFGLFCMWLYFGLGIAQNIFHLPAGITVHGHPLYAEDLIEGATWGGICFAIYQAVSFVFAFFLPLIARHLGGKATYGLTLIIGGIGLISSAFIHNLYFLFITMFLVGITWSGIMTMPYSIIAESIPQIQRGTYMGIFNITITVPQIICAIALSSIAHYFFHNHAMQIVSFGGGCIFIGGCLMILIQHFDKKNQ